MEKTVGLIGLGSMGSNIAERLHSNGYALVLYDRTIDKSDSFKSMDKTVISKDMEDFAGKIKQQEGSSTVWIMVPGGAPTNALVSELGGLLRKGDVVIDASNSMYTDSVSNYNVLKEKGIFYLDVGCAGGPQDLLKGVALMVGGDKGAFEKTKDIFRAVSGNGTYGYVGRSGSGHITKLVHNLTFYGIFPIYAESIELLLSMKEKEPDKELNANEALRLLASSPPITTDIMNAIASTYSNGTMQGDAPQLKISGMVKQGMDTASNLGVSLDATNAVLNVYKSMSEKSRIIYSSAKKIITGH